MSLLFFCANKNDDERHSSTISRSPKKMHGAFGQEAAGQNAHLAQHSAHVARNLTFIFDEHLTFADQTSSLFKSYCYYNRQLFSMPPSLHYCHLRAIVHSNSIILYCYSL